MYKDDNKISRQQKVLHMNKMLESVPHFQTSFSVGIQPLSARRWVCDRDRGDWCQRRDDVARRRIASWEGIRIPTDIMNIYTYTKKINNENTICIMSNLQTNRRFLNHI